MVACRPFPIGHRRKFPIDELSAYAPIWVSNDDNIIFTNITVQPIAFIVRYEKSWKRISMSLWSLKLKHTFKRIVDDVKQFFGTFEELEGIADISQNQSVVYIFDYSLQISLHAPLRVGLAAFAGPSCILELISLATLN